VITIVGGGLVGLATARALAGRGHRVTLVDRHAHLGAETSTHNSGVIHAGLYYPPGSLKARLCVDGRERLYEFCRAHRVPHVRCGKLVVARVADLPAMEQLLGTAAANGATLVPVGPAFVHAQEPHVVGDHAWWSPDSGWVDAQALVDALRAAVIAAGGVVLEGRDVVGIDRRPSGGWVVTTSVERLGADTLVNAAGLAADDVSRLAGGAEFAIHPCRGEYATLAPKAAQLVRGLVYPVPGAREHSLGLHLVRTLSGEVLVGPTVRFQEEKDDYETDRLPLDTFLEPARRLVPAITRENLRLGGSGIRAKLHGPDEPFADFLIGRDRQQPSLVHAAGIESPGLTACLAIGEMVADVVAS